MASNDKESSSPQQETFCVQLNDLCRKFRFGAANYGVGWPSISGKTIFMMLHVPLLGLKVKGSGSTEKKAKIDAAIKIMREIKKATEEGRTLGDIPNKKLLACCRWMGNSGKIKKELQKKEPPVEAAAGILSTWLLNQRRSLPLYEDLDPTGPAHSLTFGVTCKLDEHVTEGHGKRKKVAKNIAAEKMLTILKTTKDWY